MDTVLDPLFGGPGGLVSEENGERPPPGNEPGPSQPTGLEMVGGDAIVDDGLSRYGLRSMGS